MVHKLFIPPYFQKMSVFQATSDEAASFCFNILDAGRRGLVSHDSFVTAIQSCAALALHQQAGVNQDSRWAEDTAAGNALPLAPAANGPLHMFWAAASEGSCHACCQSETKLCCCKHADMQNDVCFFTETE
jgi:hypothetical protein